MNELKNIEGILQGIGELNNDLQYQSILISTRFPDLPLDVKCLLAAYAVDHESSNAIIRELGSNVVAKDKLIERLNEITDRQREIIKQYQEK